ncbi:MAG: rhodanese-like domain-containing protein [Actinomycetota bacterium]
MNSHEVHARRAYLQIVDVRHSHEWEAGRIEGALHIPLDVLEERLGEIDLGRRVVTACRTGNRSSRAAELLRGHGMAAESLDGGIKAWAEAGLPFTTPDGRPGAVAEAEPPPDPEADRTRDTLIEVVFAFQERFGEREPSPEEERAFMREWLISKGNTPEEAESILGS